MVDAVRNDPYSKGGADFSATELIRPSLMVRLQRQFADDIEVDVIDRIWALQGQAMHHILERGGGMKASDYEVERRMFLDNGKVKISGQMDVYYPKLQLIQDYKVTSIYAVKSGPKDEWVQQLNILAFLAMNNGIRVTRLSVCALLRDWRLSEARRDTRQYPREKVVVLDIPIWPMEKTRGYVQERIASHQKALGAKTLREVAPCSMDERWERVTKWAVMREGAKRALKLWPTKAEADAHAERAAALVPKGCYTECRPGLRVRCDGYCEVAPFCPDYQRHLKGV